MLFCGGAATANTVARSAAIGHSLLEDDPLGDGSEISAPTPRPAHFVLAQSALLPHVVSMLERARWPPGGRGRAEGPLEKLPEGSLARPEISVQRWSISVTDIGISAAYLVQLRDQICPFGPRRIEGLAGFVPAR